MSLIPSSCADDRPRRRDRRSHRRRAGAVVAVAALSVTPPALAGAPGSPVTTALSGAALPGANGLAIDRAGDLVVANAAGSRITVVDPRDGSVVDTLTAASAGVTYPDDVAVGPDGSVYWTEFTVGDVVRRSPSGRVRTVAELGPGVNPIAFGPDGRLFVAECFLGDALYEIDPDGRTRPRLVAEGIGGGCAANGMDFGPDGRLYAPQPTLARIVAIDVDDGQVEVVTEGLGPAAFAVKVGPDGTLYAVDTGLLREIDIDTGRVTRVTPLGFLADNLVVDDDGRVFVSSLTDASVVEVGRDGSQRVVSRGGLVLPQGLDVPPDDSTLLVATGNAVTPFSLPSLTAGPTVATGAPFTAASVRSSGEDWVSAAPLERTVRLFRPSDGTSVPVVSDLSFPLDVVPFGDSWLVADAGAGEVVQVSRVTPEDRAVVTRRARVPGGLAVDGGDVWVSDVRRGRVLQIIDDHDVLRRPIVVARGLKGPQGIDTAGTGGLVVVEAAAGRVSRIDLDTGRRRTLVTGLTPANPAPDGQPTDGLHFGVATAGDGTVWVSDPLANRVLRVSH